MIVFMIYFPPVLAQADVVPVGEPLHLHIRRQPVSDMTFLYFHPPDDTYNERARNDLSYRLTLLEKGSGNDTLTMYYPQDPQSNFLQFEPNATLEFTYSFALSAVKPVDPSDMTFILEVLVEIDEDRDGDYEDEVSFEISGEANSERSLMEGTVPIDIGKMEPFDGKKGGRLRVTLSRADELETSLTIYCGYGGYHSWFQLPYSKFKYLPPDGDPDDPSMWPYVLGIAGVVVVSGIAYFFFRSRQQEQRKKSEPPIRDRGRRKR
ncbi:MAG: hypothetical protein ACMUHY_03370 [Thermoplasmatota archaeon]